MSGGGGGTQTVTHELSPFQEDWLGKQGSGGSLDQLAGLMGKPQNFVSPGYVGPTSDYARSRELTRGIATQGDPTVNAGRAALNRAGGRTDTSAYNGFGQVQPYMNNLSRAAAHTIQPQVQAAFGRAGRLGGGAGAPAAMTREMTHALAPAFEAERGRGFQRAQDITRYGAGDLDRNLQVAQTAPQYQALGERSADRLSELDRKARLEEYNKRMTGAGGVDQLKYEQQEPIQRALSFIQTIMGVSPQSTTQSGGQAGNPFLQTAGTAAQIASLFGKS